MISNLSFRLCPVRKLDGALFPIAIMARVLGVSRAGYYAWLQRPPCARAEADAVLLKRVRTIHLASRQTYRAPRVYAELRARHERHSRKRIAQLMREAGHRRVTLATRSPSPSSTRTPPAK